MTLKQIDEIHQKAEGQARKQFNAHKARFVDGRDYFSSPYSEWSSEIRTTIEAAPAAKGGHKGAILLFTERGYGKIVKGWNDGRLHALLTTSLSCG